MPDETSKAQGRTSKAQDDDTPTTDTAKTQDTAQESSQDAGRHEHEGRSASAGGNGDGRQVTTVGDSELAAEVLGVVGRAGAGLLDQPQRAPSTNFTSELNNIPFRSMIGGPLQAAVDAQVASSLATIDFINQVGFTAPDADGKRELVMVDFTHSRKDVDAAGAPVTKEVALRVPLIAMLPIPSLRIEHVQINFNVKLNSVETRTVSDKFGLAIGAQGGWGPVSFKVSASYQRQSQTGVEVKKEYSLGVNVKAVQDEIPAGLEKILGALSA